jgi:hypothetical protein
MRLAFGDRRREPRLALCFRAFARDAHFQKSNHRSRSMQALAPILTPFRAVAEPLLKAAEIGKHLGLTRRGVRCLVDRRAIPVVRLSTRCHRFRLSDVETALAKLTVRPAGQR